MGKLIYRYGATRFWLLTFMATGMIAPLRSAYAQAGSSGFGGIFTSLIIFVVVIGGMAFLFRNRIREQFQRDRDRRAEISASPNGMQMLRAQLNALRIIAIIFAIVAVLVTILLLVKINNTSNWALRYDPHVHEQLGWWVMGVGLLWLLTIGLSALWIAGARNLGRTSMDRVAAIRTRLVEIEKELEARADGTKADLRAERQMLESELRQLGA